MWLFNINRHRRRQEKLSAYIDERLDPSERQELERHLEVCSLCQEDLESLRTTVALLRRMPQVPVPRSFRLTEASVIRVAPWTARYRVRLRYATALAGLLFLGIALGDVLLSPNGVIEPATAPVEQQAATPSPSPVTAPALSAPAAAPGAPAPTTVPVPEAVTQDSQPFAAFSTDAEIEALPEAREAPEEAPSELPERDQSVLSKTLDWLVVPVGVLFVAMAILVFLQWWMGRWADLKR